MPTTGLEVLAGNFRLTAKNMTAGIRSNIRIIQPVIARSQALCGSLRT